MRQSKFIESSNIPASLIRAVSRQLGGWEYFTDSAEDIRNHGADGGWNGFIWYDDTKKFYRRNRKAILQLAEQLADDIGEDLLSMVASFNCLKCYKLTQNEVAQALYLSKGEWVDSVQNAMAWFALEETARSYCDAIEYANN
jgi:hypothetical protein